MLSGKTFTPEEIVRIVRRRAWLVVLPFAIGLSVAPLISRSVAQRYRSETLIMVIPQRVPDNYVKSTVTTKIEDRLPSISNLILSRSRLERTITDFNLYTGERAQGIMEDVVERMRADIIVKLEGQESFRVSYVSSNPQTAQKVAARLASLYIEENLRDRENLAEETNQFLESQLNDAKERLIEHEKKLEVYRRQYSGQLPSQLESNLQAIQNAQLQLQAIGESTNRVRERRLLIERQIADGQTPLVPAVQAVATGSEPDASAAMTTAQQLENTQSQLELFKLRYTPDHPDIRTLERTLRDLETRLAEEARRPAPAQADPARQVSPLERVRQKRIQDLQAELEVIDQQLAANQTEEAKLKQQMADYQGKVEGIPTRESELVELTRDYSTLQLAYTNLLTKREDSKIAANLERRQIGEQFRILDPASLPERPYNQTQRLAIIASGAGAGLVLGLLVAGVLEFRDSSLKREEDVVRILSLPVLALVPVMGRAKRRRRRRVLAANVGAAAALVASVAVLALWRLRL